MPLRGRLLMAGVTAACGMGFLLFGCRFGRIPSLAYI